MACTTVANSELSLKRIATREAVILAGCLVLGILVLPIAVYSVGQFIFGSYGGDGFSNFYMEIFRAVRDGNLVVWFLVTSPYLIWQTLRWTFRLFRFAGRQP